MASELTVAMVAQAIKDNVAALYNPEGARPWDEFRAEQIRLWDYAAARGQKFQERVAVAVSPRLS